MILNLLSLLFLGATLVSARNANRLQKTHKFLKSRGNIRRDKDLAAAGTTPVWFTETYYDTTGCSGRPDSYTVYNGDACIVSGSDSYAYRYNMTQPATGCDVDFVMYTGSTTCTGTGMIGMSASFTGACQDGDGNFNTVGTSGIITCSSTDPGIPQGVDLSNSVTELYYSDSNSCLATNQGETIWYNTDVCWQSGTTQSGKYTKSSSQLTFTQYTDTTCSAGANSVVISTLGSCQDASSGIDIASYNAFSSTAAPTAAPTAGADTAWHVSVGLSIVFIAFNVFWM